MRDDYLTKLLGFQGFHIRGMKIERNGDVDVVILELGRKGGRKLKWMW